jgi:hypothetical protein
MHPEGRSCADTSLVLIPPLPCPCRPFSWPSPPPERSSLTVRRGPTPSFRASPLLSSLLSSLSSALSAPPSPERGRSRRWLREFDSRQKQCSRRLRNLCRWDGHCAPEAVPQAETVLTSPAQLFFFGSGDRLVDAFWAVRRRRWTVRRWGRCGLGSSPGLVGTTVCCLASGAPRMCPAGTTPQKGSTCDSATRYFCSGSPRNRWSIYSRNESLGGELVGGTGQRTARAPSHILSNHRHRPHDSARAPRRHALTSAGLDCSSCPMLSRQERRKAERDAAKSARRPGRGPRELGDLPPHPRI